jgi:hypothetical protein
MNVPRRPRIGPARGPCALVLLVLAAGCEEPRHVESSRPRVPANAPTQAPAPAPAAPARPADSFIVGRTTQDIKPTNDALSRNAQQANMRITARDPITLTGNAYVTAIGQTAMNNIKHALDLFQASEGRYPRDFAEFKARIIDENNMVLPRLPYYQEYRYNEHTHALEIWEDPVKKAGPMPGG